jgi:Holliday junction resolvasome RuvABC endonuclease subunit
VKVLGLDPGTLVAGWALVQDDGALLGSGTVKARFPRAATPERILDIAAQVEAVVRAHRPHWIYLEAPVVHRSGRSTVAGGQISGALLVACVAGGGPLPSLVESAEWRREVGVPKPGRRLGKGELKPFVLKHLHGLLSQRGIPFADYSDDQVEAYGIAEAGRREVVAAT